MQVIHNVRDHLNDTCTTKDVEVMAVAAAAKAQEYLKATPSQRKKFLQLSPTIVTEAEDGENSNEDKEQTEPESPDHTDYETVNEIAPPSPNTPLETDTEENLFAKNNDPESVPIKALFQPQQGTEQLGLIHTDTDN